MVGRIYTWIFNWRYYGSNIIRFIEPRNLRLKKHTKIYLAALGYSGYEFMPCEICGGVGVDIHHIECRGMGGSRTKDHIENLMLLCRTDHERFGDRDQHKEFLKETHKSFLEINGVNINR